MTDHQKPNPSSKGLGSIVAANRMERNIEEDTHFAMASTAIPLAEHERLRWRTDFEDKGKGDKAYKWIRPVQDDPILFFTGGGWFSKDWGANCGLYGWSVSYTVNAEDGKYCDEFTNNFLHQVSTTPKYFDGRKPPSMERLMEEKTVRPFVPEAKGNERYASFPIDYDDELGMHANLRIVESDGREIIDILKVRDRAWSKIGVAVQGAMIKTPLKVQFKGKVVYIKLKPESEVRTKAPPRDERRDLKRFDHDDEDQPAKRPHAEAEEGEIVTHVGTSSPL